MCTDTKKLCQILVFPTAGCCDGALLNSVALSRYTNIILLIFKIMAFLFLNIVVFTLICRSQRDPFDLYDTNLGIILFKGKQQKYVTGDCN